ncbi:MAG: dihydropteroate synthase [Bacteroidales bacterium]|nr:dihydropteroate synthase [Bacteroidales bacterium]
MTLQINIKGKLYSFDQPKVMGILNLTPDSFYDGGKYIHNADNIKARVEQILTEGADMIDMGAYSSRPGADDVTPDEEWRRLAEGFEVINKICPEAIVSVDTFRSDIARKSVTDGGASIINDISGGELDDNMFSTIADLHVPYILMHMKGTPKNMQSAPTYNDVTGEVIGYLSNRLLSLRKLGVSDIIIDPGFGFGKTVEHNYTLLRNLSDFQIFNLPVLVGISRKSMIYKTLGSSPAESLNGTTILNTLSLERGANILRVHDVKECVECVKLFQKTYSDY